MTSEYEPMVDQWYWHHDKGPSFCVTSIDDEERVIEVQHFNGDIGEFTFMEWRQLDVEPGEEPENWAGALDIGEDDDLGTEITDTARADWDEPAGDYHKDTEREDGPDKNPPQDDYGEGYMEEKQLGGDDVAVAEAVVVDLASITKRPDGVYEETLSDNWYAEYKEDEEYGLWTVDLYKHDVPEWHDVDFESLEEAARAAHDYYNNV